MGIALQEIRTVRAGWSPDISVDGEELERGRRDLNAGP